MFCSQCGTQLASNARFCSKCGLPISEEPSTVGQFSASKQPAAAPEQVCDPSALGTKWLKFYNYFSLPVGGILLLLLGVLMSVRLPALGIIIALLAILQFVVAYGLHHRKLWAWQWNWALVIITYVELLIPIPKSESHGGTADLVPQFVIRLIVASLIWMWPNYVYWRKRKTLFS